MSSSDNCCNKPLKPALPPIATFRRTCCLGNNKTPDPEPLRSTYCFSSDGLTQITKAELITMKRQWDTFERIENINSVVLNRLASIVPKNPADAEPPFYIFASNQERQDYIQGRFFHLRRDPRNPELEVPFARKPIPYTSSVVAAIMKLPPAPREGPCPCDAPSTAVNSSEIVTNRKDLSLYVRVSTFNARFPKSPYKFSGNDEYLIYKKYKDIFTCV
jgi:hypothetical protein